MRKKMMNKILWVIFISLLTVSCNHKDVYLQYHTIVPEGWSKDSIYTFDIPITDTNANYNVFVNIRNRGEYPYQNLWLFLNKTTPDNKQISDSIECYLADQRGKWLGTGVGSVFDMPVLYEQNIKFKTAGIYHYKIVQGMRDDVLTGVNDIGMRVEKVVK